MKFINLEQLSSQIINNGNCTLNLRHLELCDSHIIELLSQFSRVQKNITIDLSHNKISDFGAVLLIGKLDSTVRLVLEDNDLSENFIKQLSNRVWSHDLQITYNRRGEDTVHIIHLSELSKPCESDFNKLNQFFSDQVEALYQDHAVAKVSMLSFLLRCVKYWRSDYIHDKSYEKIISEKLLIDGDDSKQRRAELFNILVTAVDYAGEIERMINVYKDFIKDGNSQAESLLLNEVLDLIRTLEDSELVEHEYYDSFDFICDIFDYFIKRFNEEIDNSIFYGTSPRWQEFIKKLREFFSVHIDINRFDFEAGKVHNILIWEKVKSRSIFTLHRNKYLRLLSYLSGYITCRTQTQINMDRSVASLKNSVSREENSRLGPTADEDNLISQKLRFFKPLAPDAFIHLLNAIQVHDRSRVAQLLTNPDLVDEKDPDHRSCIHYWAESSAVDREIFTLLIAAKPDIIHDIVETTGWNAVFTVINNCRGDGYVKIQKLELVAQFRANFTIADSKDGKLPVHYAVMKGEEPVIEYLHKIVPETFCTRDKFDCTPRDYAPPHSAAESLLDYYQVPGEEVYALDYAPIAEYKG